MLTLIFLANGTSYRRLSFNFRIGLQSISRIVKETCKAIWDNLKPLYLILPKTAEEWHQISTLMHNRWQLSHAIGISRQI